MLKNFWLTALANLLKQKLFTAINVVGLAIGLSACLLITFYVVHETSFDRHWQRGERLYRANMTMDLPGREPYTLSITPGVLAAALQEFFPEEIERVARIGLLEQDIVIDDKVFSGIVAAADSSVTGVFDFDVLSGDLQATLNDASSVALSDKRARDYFGAEEPLGKTLTLTVQGAKKDYRVGAVYRLPAGNTILELPSLIALEGTIADAEMLPWTRAPVSTWVLLNTQADAAAINTRMNTFSDQHADIPAMGVPADTAASKHLRFDIRNVASLYLDATLEDVNTAGNANTVQAFAAISVLVLLIACINYTLLSTAKASQRAKEIAIRKVAGASRAQLLVQYLGESLLVVLLALLLALVAVELLLPAFESLTGKQLRGGFSFPQLLASLLMLLVATGIAGGLYPALLLARLLPATALGKHREGVQNGKGINLRNALVVFQFGISIALMIATATIYLQVQFVGQRDHGFNSENVIVLDGLLGRPELAERIVTLKQRLAELPQVSAVSASAYRPTATTILARNSQSFALEKNPTENFVIYTGRIDEDFFGTYEIELLAGRNFSLERDRPWPGGSVKVEDINPAATRSLIINESLSRQLGFTTPDAALGEATLFPGAAAPYLIIGVVADSLFYSQRVEPRPEIYTFQPGSADALAIRYRGDPQALLPQIHTIWRELTNAAEFSPLFVEQLLADEFLQERTEARLLVGFSVLAIVIACLGLYGSAIINVEKRTREIGIRKVLGAELREIVTLLVWQFSKPVLVANVFAWPLALWAMLNWLQRFPYRMDTLILLPLCVMAGAVALSIAWMTVAANTLRVASARPVLALRYE